MQAEFLNRSRRHNAYIKYILRSEMETPKFVWQSEHRSCVAHLGCHDRRLFNFSGHRVTSNSIATTQGLTCRLLPFHLMCFLHCMLKDNIYLWCVCVRMLAAWFGNSMLRKFFHIFHHEEWPGTQRRSRQT